jgi:hypothetical protein
MGIISNVSRYYERITISLSTSYEAQFDKAKKLPGPRAGKYGNW